LTPVDKHKRVHAALRDEPRGDDGLAKCRCGRQYPRLVAQHGVSCGLLLPPKLASKAHVQTAPVVTLVANGRAHTKVGERPPNIVEAPAGQANVMRVVLGAGDDTWLVVGRQPHRLSSVELRVLKRS
jgi:hypothetical protein